MALGVHNLVFRTFILKAQIPDYSVSHETYDFLFNSYYFTLGQMHARPRRGLLSRPVYSAVFLICVVFCDAGRKPVEFGLDRGISESLRNGHSAI
ncbi:MAG: hypothetical protein OES09_12740 [Gammaproteobacteria bacterium]|nr:hypothetical protein [Gammaproteobacteria bacterium]